MLVTQSTVLSVPSTLGVILQIRETATYQRTLYFRNLSALTLAVQLEYSADGGSTWVLIDTAFNVGAAGSGSDVIVKNVTNTNILRIKASGGAAGLELYTAYTRMYIDANNIWTSPVL